MKEIILPVVALKEALPGLNKIVSKRAALPVLQHIRLARNAEGIISIQATDLDSFCTYTAKEPQPGLATEMLIPLDQLARTAKSLKPEDTIAFIQDGKDKVKLRHSIGGSLVERNLNTLPADQFPPQPTINQPAIPLEPGFGLALRQALECCSEDTSRAILKGACLDVTDRKFHYVVGTNGRCLFSANSFCFDLQKSVVIPDSKFLEWPDLLDEELVSLSVEPAKEEQPASESEPYKAAEPGWIKLQSGCWTFITKEIDGQFPNWKQVIPETGGKWTRIQLSDESIKQLVLVVPSLPGDDSPNRPIRLRVESNQLVVEGQNLDDATWTSIPIQNVTITGKPVTVALNRSYLTNALRFGLNQLEVENPLSPVVFSKGGKKMVIMPINLEGPGRINAPQPEPEPEATSPEPEQTQPPAEPEAQTERTAMPTATRATTPEPMTRFQPIETNNNGSESTVKSLVEHVEQIKDSLKGIVRELNTVIDTVKLAEKERKSSEKEIEAIRSKLRQIQSVAI